MFKFRVALLPINIYGFVYYIVYTAAIHMLKYHKMHRRAFLNLVNYAYNLHYLVYNILHTTRIIIIVAALNK